MKIKYILLNVAFSALTIVLWVSMFIMVDFVEIGIFPSTIVVSITCVWTFLVIYMMYDFRKNEKVKYYDQ